MIGRARVIEDDLFFVCRRLKGIDSSYYVVENYEKKRLELHSNAQRGGSLALVLPFKSLDERTVTFVLRTRASRKKQLIEEMERDNERLTKNKAYQDQKLMEKEVENEFSKL